MATCRPCSRATCLDELNAQVERLPKLEEQLRGFDDLGIKEKLAKTSVLAREREIAKTGTDGVQSFRDALTDLPRTGSSSRSSQSA